MEGHEEASDTWRPSWVRGCKITELTWIDKDVLAWCSGMYIVFFQITQNKQLIRWCSKQSTGEGACCISGQPTLRLFAFSEKVPNPRILVYSYPSMNKISEFAGGCPSGYLAITFTTYEYVVSVGSFPNFSLIVWSWRTGEKITLIDTRVHDMDKQVIKAAHGSQTVLAQLGKVCGKLYIWEMSFSGKTVILTDHQVVLPRRAEPYGVDWCPEPGQALLAITDRDGHVYLSNHDGSNVYRIVLSQRCGACQDIDPPEVCWYRDGIVLKTTFCQIRYYRKNEHNLWRKVWYMKFTTKPRLLLSNPLKYNRLFYYTLEGDLMQLNIQEGKDTPIVERCLSLGGHYHLVDFVYPWGHHLVAVDNEKELAVIDSHCGKEINRINLTMIGNISCLNTHPDYPLVAVTSVAGELVFVGLTNPDQPQIILQNRLQENDLDLLKFSYSGNYIAVGQLKIGICFCISLVKTKPITMVARLEAKRRIADVMLYDSRDSLQLFVLQVSSVQVLVGYQIFLYNLPAGQHEFSQASCVLELANGFQYLCYGLNSPTRIIGTPYLSRQLHVLDIQGSREVHILDAMATKHQVRQANIFVDRHWVTTTGIDGITVIRGTNIRTCMAILMLHHRSDLGAKKAIVKPSGDLVLSLGHDGSLVATRKTKTHKNNETNQNDAANLCSVRIGEYDEKKKELLADYDALDPVVVEMLTRLKQGLAPLEELEGKTWLEWRLEKNILEEAKECAQRRADIRADFTVLREKIVRMINENEDCPEIERLPLSAFDLDKVTREQKLKAAKDEREDLRLELESNCISMDRVVSWLKSTFWDSQQVLGESIFSIFGTTEVTNYPLVAQHPHVNDHLRCLRFSKDVLFNMMEGDVFCPWRICTASQLQVELKRTVRMYPADEKLRIDALLAAEEEEEKEIDVEEVENQRAMEGMTTYRFIEPSSYYFSQFETYGYLHMVFDNRNLVHDCHNLRLFFNKLFNDIYVVKEREIGLVHERNERLRYIDSELRLMFKQAIPDMPADPEWHHKEKPKSIVQVLDQEVKAKPYISPSQQDLLDRQAAEAERIRQLLLADDFRERALMTMMDGVLEVRWEDIIKKDVPQPPWMQTKQREQYTPEDIIAVQQYEKDVAFLAQERERYKRILEADFSKVSGTLREGIEKFNGRLEDFLLVRMKVEAAIQQLNLRYIRGCLRNVYRLDMFRKDDAIKEKITGKQKKLDILTGHLHSLQNTIVELHAQYDNLCNREKVQERKFKSEFPGVGKGTLELLARQYKRRPRVLPKTVVAYEIQEVGRCAVALTKPVYLLQNCIDYLKGLDTLDARPSALPQSVDAGHWEHLIRIRRHKVDIEMRIRAVAIEIAEADRTVSEFNKKIAKHRIDIDALKDQLTKLRQDKLLFDRDLEVQFVLKMGQIEVLASGSREDTENAIFIPRSEIENVNRVILAAGEEKLKAMNRTINFRRGILFKEWEHKCLNMRIEDLREELYCLQNVVVTREIQEYLKRKARGFRDKTSQQLERELETLRKSSTKAFKEWNAKLDNVEKRIRTTRRSNSSLDKRITEMNVTRCEMELQRDFITEQRQREYFERKMKIVIQRSNLIRKLQDNYAELLVLQTEHELLRLRKYPALKFFKTLYDGPE